MGERVKQQLPFLQLLTISGSKQVAALLDTISDDQVAAVCSVFKNIRLKNIPISRRDLSLLLRKKKYFILLTSNETSPSEKLSIIKKEAKIIIQILKKIIDEVVDLLE